MLSAVEARRLSNSNASDTCVVEMKRLEEIITKATIEGKHRVGVESISDKAKQQLIDLGYTLDVGKTDNVRFPIIMW